MKILLIGDFVVRKKISFVKLMVLTTIFFNINSFADEIPLDHLSLQQSVSVFEASNKELLLAKRNIEGAEADKLTAAQAPNPEVSLGLSNLNLNFSQGNKNSQRSNSLFDKTLQSTVQISQLLERGNKRDLRTSVADDAYKASQFDFKDTFRQQELALENAYYDLVLAQESEKIQSSNVDLYEKSLNAASLRLKAGDIAASDVARIKVDFLRAQNDLRQSVANRQKAQATLAYIIGQEKNVQSIVATDTWPQIEASATTQSNESNTEDRADVLAAKARSQQAGELRNLAQSLKARDVTVALAYQHFPGQEPAVGVNTIGATVSFPLFTNYQYQGEIARAETNYYIAQDLKEQIQAQAIRDLSKAKADLNAALDKVNRFDGQMLDEGKKAADAAEFAYTHGAVDVTYLLDSRRTLHAIELDAAASHADFAKSLAAWHATIKNEKE